MDITLWNTVWDGQIFGYYLSQLFSILACAVYFGNMKLRSIFLTKSVKAFEIDKVGFDEKIRRFISEKHLSGSKDLSNLILRCVHPIVPLSALFRTVRFHTTHVRSVHGPHSFRGPEPYFKLSVIQSILEQNKMTKSKPKTIPNSYLVKVFYFGFLIFTISQFYCTFRNRNENDEICSLETPFKDFSESILAFDFFTIEGNRPSFQCLVFKKENCAI